MISLRSSFKLLANNNGALNKLKNGNTIKSFSTSSFSLCPPNEKTSSGSGSEYPPNSSIVTSVVHNRNPRNLEKLRIGEKPVGWTLEKQGRSFWNRVNLQITGKHVLASVVHFRGAVPVEASTLEWCIKKQLYSTKDVSAVKAVAQVLAQRCLQTGINEVYCHFTEEELAKEKVQVFVKALEDGGLSLTEPDQLPCEERVHLNYPYINEKAWEVFEELDEKILSKLEVSENESNSSRTSVS